MTERADVDVTVGEWLRRTAVRRAPRSTLEVTLARTRASQPLRGWQAMVLVPQMRLGSRVLVGSPTARRLLAATGLLIAILATGIAVVGAALLTERLNRSELFVYAANPASLSPEICEEVGDCRNPLSLWPGGRFLVEQAVDAPPAATSVVVAPWPFTILALGVSPTGSHVAYLRTQTGFPMNCSQLVVRDRQTGMERVVAVEWASASPGHWLGGDRLAFVADGRCSPGGDGVFSYDATNDTLERLLAVEDVPELSGTQPIAVHAWHPDGRRLLLTQEGPSSITLIVTLDGTKVTAERVACDCPVSRGAWSPDGTSLLLEVNHGDLAIADADGSGLRVIPTTGWASSASWSPNGRAIVFASSLPKAEGPRSSPDHDILVVTPGGGEPRVVAVAHFPYAPLATMPRWSPDGERIYWSDDHGTWSVRPDGTDLRRLPLPAQIDLRWVEGRAR